MGPSTALKNLEHTPTLVNITFSLDRSQVRI